MTAPDRFFAFEALRNALVVEFGRPVSLTAVKRDHPDLWAAATGLLDLGDNPHLVGRLLAESLAEVAS